MKLSVLIPFARADESLRRQVAEVEKELQQAAPPCGELVLVADTPRAELPRWLFVPGEETIHRRILRLRRPQGPAGAVAAAILAAGGEHLVLMAPGETYPARLIPEMVGHLVRADLVWGRRRCRGWRRLPRWVAVAPYRVCLGPLVRDPGCLLWAARAEVFQGLEQALPFVPLLPWWVAAQGYRVSQVTVTPQGPQRYRLPGPWPWHLAAAAVVLARAEAVAWEHAPAPSDRSHPEISSFPSRCERNQAA